MIVWINGAFGVGKTSVARELARRWPTALRFDPEQIGFLLRRLIPSEFQTGDFQDLKLWRQFTIETCIGLVELTGRPLIVPMTLQNYRYFEEILMALRKRSPDVRHFVLVARPTTLQRRIRFRLSFPSSKRWAMERINQACETFSAPEFAIQIMTDGRTISEVTDDIIAYLPNPLPVDATSMGIRRDPER